MITLAQISTGSTVKLNHNGEEYKGIVLKHTEVAELGFHGLLLVDHLVPECVLRYTIRGSVNVVKFNSGSVVVQQARLPKEIGDLLRAQYTAVMDFYDLQQQIHQLEKKRYVQARVLDTTTAAVTNGLYTKSGDTKGLGDTKRPVDTRDLTFKIQQELENLFQIEKTRAVGQYSEGEVQISLKGLEKGNNNSVTIRYILQLSVEKQVMSKEYEDRVRGDEGITQHHVKRYTPTIEPSAVAKIFGISAKIVETKTECEEQDKGWVKFYRKALVETTLDPSQYEKSIALLGANLDKTYPERR